MGGCASFTAPPDLSPAWATTSSSVSAAACSAASAEDHSSACSSVNSVSSSAIALTPKLTPPPPFDSAARSSSATRSRYQGGAGGRGGGERGGSGGVGGVGGVGGGDGGGGFLSSLHRSTYHGGGEGCAGVGFATFRKGAGGDDDGDPIGGDAGTLSSGAGGPGGAPGVRIAHCSVNQGGGGGLGGGGDGGGLGRGGAGGGGDGGGGGCGIGGGGGGGLDGGGDDGAGGGGGTRGGGNGGGGSPMSPSSFAAFRTVGPSVSTASRSWHPVSSERVRRDAHSLPFSPLSHFNDRVSASMSWQSLGAPGLTTDGGGVGGAGTAGRFGGGDRAGGGGGLNIWARPTSTRSRWDASAIGGESSACRGARGDGVRRGWVPKLGVSHASNGGPRP